MSSIVAAAATAVALRRAAVNFMIQFIGKKGKVIPHKFRRLTVRTLRAILYSEWAYHCCFLGDIAAARLESWKAAQHVTYLLEPAELI